jgi:hypothetical protein
MPVLDPHLDDAPAVERPSGGPPAHGNGRPPGGGNGVGGDEGRPDAGPPLAYYQRRRSFWPFLLDLGVVLALFGFIITGRFLIVIGAVLFVVALAGWIREARAEYSRLAD